MTSHSSPLRRARVALLVLDVITDLDFADGARLLKPAMRAASSIARLAQRARARRVPVIYVNDDFGLWRADVDELLARCSDPRSKGKQLVEQLAPQATDLFLFKPKHSAFFGTSLDALLDRLGARKLVITGFSAHQCVLFTATDAHVRDLDLVIPSDCVASPTPSQTRFALRYFRDVLNADVRGSASIVFRTQSRAR